MKFDLLINRCVCPLSEAKLRQPKFEFSLVSRGYDHNKTVIRPSLSSSVVTLRTPLLCTRLIKKPRYSEALQQMPKRGDKKKKEDVSDRRGPPVLLSGSRNPRRASAA